MKKTLSIIFCAMLMMAFIPRSADAAFRPMSLDPTEQVETLAFRPMAFRPM